MAREPRNKCVSHSIAKLYLNTELADVNFIFKLDDEIEKVPANKNILATSSPVFYTMFFGSIKEKDDVKIADSYPAAFKEFLQFYYLEDFTLKMENIEEVVRLADKYDMVNYLNDYTTSCVRNLGIGDICWGYQLAIFAKHDELKVFCEKNICAFTNDVFKSSTFLHCDRTVLHHILQLDSLMCMETEVFTACLSWAKFNCQQNGIDENKPENLKTQLGVCFYQIRFGAMTSQEFVEYTLPYQEMFTRSDFANFLYRDSNKFTPNTFIAQPRSKAVFLWDASKVLKCSRDIFNGSSLSTYHTQNTESVWFSSNVPLTMGAFFCYSLRSNGYSASMNYNVIINEIDAQSFKVVAPTEVVFNGKIEIKGDKEIQMALPQPIVINPRKMYEIRLETTANTNHYYYQHSECQSEAKLEENIVVKFHQNPNNDRRGLVSRIYFNQL